MLLVSPIRWWVLLVEAGLFGLFGLATWFFPLWLGLFCIVFFAVIAVLAGIVATKERRRLIQWWLNLVVAANGLFLAVLAVGYVLWGGGVVTPEFLGVLIGIQALVQGSIGIAISLDHNHETKVRGLNLLFCLSSGLFGVLILANPYIQFFSKPHLLAGYGLVGGLTLLPGSLRLRNRR